MMFFTVTEVFKSMWTAQEVSFCYSLTADLTLLLLIVKT